MDSAQATQLSKAEDWLADRAQHLPSVQDQEALIYLHSRGRGFHDEVLFIIGWAPIRSKPRARRGCATWK